MPRTKMKRQLLTVYVVIGDGKTESIYIESIKKAFRHLFIHHTLKPEIPTHSRVSDLEVMIEKYLDRDKVLCVIDMDTKLNNPQEMQQYLKLKSKYKSNKKVFFFETHPCTELWFYYHFEFTTRLLKNYDPEVKKMIRSKIPKYEKKAPFCTHQHICKHKGDLTLAISNATSSMSSKNRDEREYTYSEMANFFQEIGIDTSKKQ